MYSQVLQKSKPQVCFFLKTFLVISTLVDNNIRVTGRIWIRIIEVCSIWTPTGTVYIIYNVACDGSDSFQPKLQLTYHF